MGPVNSKFLYHSSCPSCGSSDANSVYSDGHTYCFSCRKVTHPDKVSQLRQRLDQGKMELPSVRAMPEDQYETPITKDALMWLYSYGITDYEIVQNHIRWSPARRWLTFPFYEGGALLGWQARVIPYAHEQHMLASRPKWLSFGPMQDILALYGMGDARPRSIIIVEDILSAIKVGREYPTRCIFGSAFSTVQAIRMKLFTSKVIFWLDKDKTKESFEFAEMCRGVGLDAGCIVTDLDPKANTMEEIHEYVQGVAPDLEPNAQSRDIVKSYSYNGITPKRQESLVNS